MELDATYGSEARLRALHKAIPIAEFAVIAATPSVATAVEDLTRRFVRHEVVVEEGAQADETRHNGGEVIFEKPFHLNDEMGEELPAQFTDRERVIVHDAVKKTALKPRREGDDLVALDFLAEKSDSRLEGGVSKLILDTTRRHRKTRSVLTNLLLRLV